MIIKKDRIYIYDCELKENLINEFKNLKGKHYKNLDSKGSGWSFSINYLSQINNLLNLIPTIQNNIVENKDEQDNIVENKDIQNNILTNKHLLNIEQLKKIKYNIEKKIPKTPFSSPIKHRYKYDISKKLIKKFEKYLII